MSADSWHIGRGRVVRVDRPVVMAILNLTPDSFSDGGELPTPEHAARAAVQAVAEGAAILDVGGESTRPGADRIDEAEQRRRVLPAIVAVREAVGEHVPISIDTTLATVAEAAIEAGADIINDVSAGTEDPEMLALAARRGAGLILMHRLAPPRADRYSDRYQTAPDYGTPAEGRGVVQAVREFLRQRLEAAIAAGIEPGRIVLDPGLGFGKTVEQNLELIAGTPRLLELGRPVLSALSRKSFVARAAGMGPDTQPRERIAASVGLSVAHLCAGARVFRVHDVAPHVQALAAAWATRPKLASTNAHLSDREDRA